MSLDNVITQADEEKPLSGCPFSSRLKLGRNSLLKDTEHRRVIKQCVSEGKKVVRDLLDRLDDLELHPSEVVTILSAVAIDRFCTEALEDGEVREISEALWDWGSNLEGDSKTLMDALADRSDSFIHREAWLREKYESKANSNVAVYMLQEGIINLLILLEEQAVNADAVELVSDNVAVRAGHIIMQAHTFDDIAVDPDPVNYRSYDEIKQCATANERLVEAIRARSQFFGQSRFLSRFSKKEPKTSRSVAGYDIFNIDYLAQKPRIGCPFYYSGRLRFMLEYGLEVIRNRPKDEAAEDAISFWGF